MHYTAPGYSLTVGAAYNTSDNGKWNPKSNRRSFKAPAILVSGVVPGV